MKRALFLVAIITCFTPQTSWSQSGTFTLEQLIFPDEVHSFLTHAHWLDAFEAAVDFFDRHLKKGVP